MFQSPQCCKNRQSYRISPGTTLVEPHRGARVGRCRARQPARTNSDQIVVVPWLPDRNLEAGHTYIKLSIESKRNFTRCLPRDPFHTVVIARCYGVCSSNRIDWHGICMKVCRVLSKYGCEGIPRKECNWNFYNSAFFFLLYARLHKTLT